MNKIKKQSLLMILSTILVAILSFIYASSISPKFKSEAQLFPTKDSSTSNRNSLGSIAALAGIGPSSESSKAQYAILLMKSDDVILEFFRKVILEHAEKDKFIYEINNELRQSERSLEKYTENKERLIGYFKDKLQISNDKNSGVLTVSVESESGYLSKEILSKYVIFVDEKVRRKEKEENDRFINYLTDRIKIEKNVDIRNSMYNLLEEKLSTSTLINAGENYTYEYISEPNLTFKKSSPRVGLIVISSTILWLVFLISIRFSKTLIARNV